MIKTQLSAFRLLKRLFLRCCHPGIEGVEEFSQEHSQEDCVMFICRPDGLFDMNLSGKAADEYYDTLIRFHRGGVEWGSVEMQAKENDFMSCEAFKYKFYVCYESGAIPIFPQWPDRGEKRGPGCLYEFWTVFGPFFNAGLATIRLYWRKQIEGDIFRNL